MSLSACAKETVGGIKISEVPPDIYKRRDLALFVTSRFVSTCAMQVQSVAIGWQIYDMVRTPLALGLVGLCQFVPMFLCTLPAGELTDRFNQRRIYAPVSYTHLTLPTIYSV